MHIDVCLSSATLSEEAVKGKTVVVVDVLRACSTIVTALANGAREILPVADMADAGRAAANLDAETCLLGGERDGKRIEGYAAGNSPLEYAPERVARKIVVLSTSNGTRAFTMVRAAEEAVAGCFLNLSRVVRFLGEQRERDAEPEILILCAGQNGRVAMEDVLCAGMILDRLLASAPGILSDPARIALMLYRSNRKRLAVALFECEQTQRLIAVGYGDDVAYCTRIDALHVLPRYSNNLLTLDREDRELAFSETAAESISN